MGLRSLMVWLIRPRESLATNGVFDSTESRE